MAVTKEVIPLADGQVIYEVRSDDSNLDSDLNHAEKIADSKLSKIGGAASKAAKIGGAALTAMGSAAVAVGTKAVSGAVDFDKAMNQFSASTGVARQDLSEYEGTLKSIYANNYGDSFEDIADAMATVKQQMGSLGTQEGFQEIVEDAFLLRDTFGYDVSESVRAANALMNQFGIDGDRAMNLIATGAQNGLDYSGELLDSISEYSVQFAKVGLDAEDMFAIMQKGADTGAFNLDKVGDAIKEMSIRVVDGSETTAEGFAAIGLDADVMSAKFAAGGESAKEAFNETIAALASMEDPLAQSQAGVALFGSMWEDLGPDVVTALADIESSTYDTSEALEGMRNIKYDDLGSMLEGLGRTLETLLLPLGEQLIPLIQQVIEEIMPVLEENLPMITESIGSLVTAFMPIVESLLPPLLETMSTLLPLLTQVIEEIMPPLVELLNVLLPPIMELVETLLPPLVELFSALIPPIAEILESLLPPLIDVLKILIEPITDLIDMLLPPLLDLLDEIKPLINALMPIIKDLAKLFGDTLGRAIESLKPTLDDLMRILGGLIDFITGIFTGDWEKAWNGVVDMFKGIFNLIPDTVERVINGAIDLINGIIQGINTATGWIGIPAIQLIPHVSLPRFHAGGIVDFETGEGPALLKDGEMVLTQAQQAELFALANGAGLASNPHEQIIIVESPPIYLDGRLITKSVTTHQYNDIKVRRLR